MKFTRFENGKMQAVIRSGLLEIEPVDNDGGKMRAFTVRFVYPSVIRLHEKRVIADARSFEGILKEELLNFMYEVNNSMVELEKSLEDDLK